MGLELARLEKRSFEYINFGSVRGGPAVFEYLVWDAGWLMEFAVLQNDEWLPEERRLRRRGGTIQSTLRSRESI